jgi:hypothetical protein
MDKYEEIKKLLDKNTLFSRQIISHEQSFRSKGDIDKYFEDKMTVDIIRLAQKENKIDFKQAIGEQEKTIQAQCTILHPDVVERILELLK